MRKQLVDQIIKIVPTRAATAVAANGAPDYRLWLFIANVVQHLDFQAIILYVHTRRQGNHTDGNLRSAGLPSVRYCIIVYPLTCILPRLGQKRIRPDAKRLRQFPGPCEVERGISNHCPQRIQSIQIEAGDTLGLRFSAPHAA